MLQKMFIEKKKLFICITKSNWGGAQRYVFDIATNTPRDQFDTTVLLGGNGDLKTKLEDASVKTILLKNSQRDIDTKKEFGLLFELIDIFKKEKPDIVHLNSSKMGFIGALAGRISGVKKIIFTAHGWAFNEDRNFISKISFRILHILTILLSHKTVAVSEITKKQIGKIFDKKFVVIRNGIRDINFKEEDDAKKFILEKIREINPNTKNIPLTNYTWVGTISELHKTKGLNYVIEAISKIKNNIIFIIIGEGEKRKELEEQIIKLGLSNKVFLVGKVDNASTYLKAFDIFTLSSITEALPYVLLEAGYAGLPIVASNVGGIPEIIENDKTGLLIEPRHPEGIKTSIESLMKNTEKSSYLGKNMKDKILKNFTQKNMLERTFGLYKNK
jgi:glycosyltransferase involved in cell wall biosynthesis